MSPVAPDEEAATPPGDGGVGNPLQRYVPLLVWIVVCLTVVMIPAKIIGYGYLPVDDALRHAAKAVSGKPWPEILVLRDGFGIDPHPGWHAILGWGHRALNLNAENLVLLSVGALMTLVSVSVLPWLRRPESWLAALLAASICVPRIITRLTLGRPFLVTIAACITLLLIWSRIRGRRPRIMEVAASVLLIALDSWIHGGWYQMGLPVAALLLALRWRAAGWYAVCWLAGSVLGCAFTGHPWQFLFQSVQHLFGVFGGGFHLDRQLTAELLPSGGDPPLVLAVAAMLLWRARTPGWKASELLNPIFMMAIIGWVLGLKMYRFWDDWGLPSATLWLAMELQTQFEQYVDFDSWKRLAIGAGLGLSIFLASTSDLSGRYTNNLTTEYLTQDDPNLAGWLPEKDGILYSGDMALFFQTFFKNPTAQWRYILGFEPALMPAEDLAVYRKIQWTYGDPRAYEPWVQKMRPEDRLVIRSSSGAGQPSIPQLEWRYAVGGLWIGRLPRK